MRAFTSKMEADEVDLQRTHWVGCVLGAAEGERIERATRCISVVYVVVVHGGERVGGKVQVQVLVKVRPLVYLQFSIELDRVTFFIK